MPNKPQSSGDVDLTHLCPDLSSNKPRLAQIEWLPANTRTYRTLGLWTWRWTAWQMKPQSDKKKTHKNELSSCHQIVNRPSPLGKSSVTAFTGCPAAVEATSISASHSWHHRSYDMLYSLAVVVTNRNQISSSCEFRLSKCTNIYIYTSCQRPHLHIPSCFLSFMAYWCKVINNFAETCWKYNFSPRCAYQNDQSWPPTYHLLYYTIGGWPFGRLGWILMKINSQVWLSQLWGTSCAMIPLPAHHWTRNLVSMCIICQPIRRVSPQ